MTHFHQSEIKAKSLTFLFQLIKMSYNHENWQVYEKVLSAGIPKWDSGDIFVKKI